MGPLIMIGLALVSVLLRVPFFHVPMIADEGGYAYVAHFWSADYELYRDIPFYRPQAIFLVYRLVFSLLGEGVPEIRLFAALYNALTLLSVFWLSRIVFSERVAVASSGIFAVFSVGPSMEGFTANAEVFTQLPIVLCAILTWKKRWGLAGLAAGAAFLMKPSGLSAYALSVSWAFFSGVSIRGAALVSLSFALAILPSVLHGLWVGWGYFWGSVFGMRAIYAAAQTDAGWVEQIRRLAAGSFLTSPSWAIPAVLSAFKILGGVDRKTAFGLLWLGTSVLGMAMGGSWYLHYFIQIAPPLALLGGAGIRGLRTEGRRWFLAAPLVVSLVLFTRDIDLWLSSPEEISWEIWGRSGYLAADEVARYITANTEEADRIFVAFDDAEVYYLSKRRASFPRMYYADFRYSQELFDGAMESIREGEPAFVVVVQAPPEDRMSWEEFLSILSEGYERASLVQPSPEGSHPVLVFRRKTDR